MDTDGRAFGGRNVSSKEVDQIIKTLDKERYNGMSSGDLEKTRDVLSEFQ